MNRLEFTNEVKRAARARAGGICECGRVPQLGRPQGCGQRLGDGNTFYEHIVQAGIKDDASLDNCAALVRTCWREKTDLIDLPVVADTKRMEDRASGIKRRPRGRRLQGRGFYKPEQPKEFA